MDRCSRYKCLNVYLTGWTLILDSEVRFTLEALRPLGRQIVLCLHAMALYASSTCPQSQGYRLTVVPSTIGQNRARLEVFDPCRELNSALRMPAPRTERDCG